MKKIIHQTDTQPAGPTSKRLLQAHPVAKRAKRPRDSTKSEDMFSV